jgi:hypothetical protein
MALILASRTNLAFLKNSLRKELPSVRSSHLTEALAWSMGYRTHAAMLAQTKEGPAPVLQVDLALMAERLDRFGYPAGQLECVTKVVRSPHLPERIAATYRTGDRIENDRWFYECRRRNIPMINIETRRKYVSLRWDCITIDPRFESHVQASGEADLVYPMAARFREITKGMPGKPIFSGKSFVGSIDPLSPELAREIAEIYFEMLYTPMHSPVGGQL